LARVFDVSASDFITIGLLVLLEGLLSADNALVLAVLVMGLPRAEQNRALRYGLVAAFAFRFIAVSLAAFLLRAAWIKLAGGGYLLYLAAAHFLGPSQAGSGRPVPAARPAWGLSAFWMTVVRVELINIAFSVDSILVAVAMSPKLWVVMTGGIVGIVAMRIVAGELIALLRRYPAIVDGAFAIIAWVGIKLLLEYAHAMGWIGWEIPRALALGLIAVIFLVSYVLARRKGAAPDDDVAGSSDA
jgi:YkoY family integral membrane protein